MTWVTDTVVIALEIHYKVRIIFEPKILCFFKMSYITQATTILLTHVYISAPKHNILLFHISPPQGP